MVIITFHASLIEQLKPDPPAGEGHEYCGTCFSLDIPATTGEVPQDASP
jgi:hypothetical protein